MITLFPYSFINDSIAIQDGVFSPPPFCREHIKCDELCKSFHKEVGNTNTPILCPYGFAAITVDSSVTLTCLNVDKISDEKRIRKVLKGYFYPRISYNIFIKTVQYVSEQIVQQERINELDDEKFQADKSNLDNTIHEIRHINNILKTQVEETRLAYDINGQCDQVDKGLTDIYSLSNLLSIRLDSYDAVLNPGLNLKDNESRVQVYRTIERLSKSMNPYGRERNIRVIWTGSSHLSYPIGKAFDIAFFIIIENAIKYSPDGKDVHINYQEDSRTGTMSVWFKNWGICPDEEEMPVLCNRGYRSMNVRKKSQKKGQGLGLYMLSQICEMCNVELSLSVEKETLTISDIVYRTFVVKLSFVDGEI